jgi:sulfoxide reductase heme-binding subunit YedZ
MLQQFLLINKRVIIKIWYALLIGWFLFFLVSIQLTPISFWIYLGKKTATVALITFWITLMPGMMKRFQIAGWLLPVRTLLMLYRRQLGITMYVLALTHVFWSRFLPILTAGGDIWRFNSFQLAGLIAIILLTPVFITSNDWSVKNLGKWWDIIHALVYVVVWILFLHVALQSTGWKTLITLIIASLEAFSLFWARLQTAN